MTPIIFTLLVNSIALDPRLDGRDCKCFTDTPKRQCVIRTIEGTHKVILVKRGKEPASAEVVVVCKEEYQLGHPTKETMKSIEENISHQERIKK